MLLLVTDHNVSSTDIQPCRSSAGVTWPKGLYSGPIPVLIDTELVGLASLQVMSQICF